MFYCDMPIALLFSQCAESHFPAQELERGLDTMLDAYGAAGAHLEQPGEAQGPSEPQPAPGTRKKPARPSKKPRGAAGELDESHRLMHSSPLQSIPSGGSSGALCACASGRHAQEAAAPLQEPAWGCW